MRDVDKGADVIVTRCLELEPGETLHLLTWGAAEVVQAIERATQRASGTLQRIQLEPLASAADGASQVLARMTGATASALVASDGLSPSLRFAVIAAASHVRSRHLHMPHIDVRVLSQGARAEPEILAKINERVIELVRPPSRVHVTSAAGTSLEIGFSPGYNLVSANGRPARGAADNLPSGSVYTYPSSVDGKLVVDRALIGGDEPITSVLRRHPVTFVFEAGQVTAIETDNAFVAKHVDDYLESHPRARAVGHVTFPTNYLVRSEIGVQAQDNLLPGLNVSLGFSASSLTNAPIDAPVQMTLLARRLTVTANGKPIVTDGRFEQHVVAGLDPFR